MGNRDFEEWYSGTYRETIHILPNGQYASLRQQHSWDAWQAQQAKIDELQARVDEALKILKDWDDQSYRDDMDQLTGEIEDILKAVEK